MRTRAPGALAASIDSNADYDALQRHLLRPVRNRRSLSRALGEADLSGFLSPQPANSWDFVAMGSRATTDTEPEQALVESIARAMQNPPLMRRLASIGADFGEPPQASPAAALLAPPQPAPSLRAPMDTFTAIAAGIGAAPLINSAGMPPRSAEWLGKAKRENRRALLRNAAAWLATIFIGGSIIVASALMLRP